MDAMNIHRMCKSYPTRVTSYTHCVQPVDHSHNSEQHAWHIANGIRVVDDLIHACADEGEKQRSPNNGPITGAHYAHTQT